MKKRFTSWLSFLTVCFMLALYCSTAQAVLLDVGPTNLPSPPGNGIPAWYRDTNRLPLGPCLSQATFPGGLAACILLPDPGFNPALPLVFPTNFPSESFYFLADAALTSRVGNIVYRAALEAAFPTGVVAPYNPITFSRIRIMADLPVAGTYKFTHPYGVETVVAAAPGARAIVFVRDIGVGAFTGAVAGDLGPWLIMQGFPQVIGAETFIGNYNGASLPVSGSPFGTNFFRVDGPVGSNLDGLGNDFLQTNLFIMMGQIDSASLATPLTVDRATYTRDAINTLVEVYATTQPVANVRTNVAPNPFALLGILSALQFSDVATTGPIPTTPMATNLAQDGKFYAASAPFSSLLALPATVRVSNTADLPVTSVDVPLVDEVVISEASFAPALTGGGTLKVVALSGDKLTPPTLTVSMKDGLQVVPLGTILNGSGTLPVIFPLTITLPAPFGTKTYNIPPESVTVTSAYLGSETKPVTTPQNQAPLAVNDTATVAPGGSVPINVAGNDTTTVVGGLNLGSVAIVTAPTKGTLSLIAGGFITYTAGPTAIGTDTFTYTILDSVGVVSNVATVTVTISNTPPIAGTFTAITLEDTVVSINVVALPTVDPDAALNPSNNVNPATVLVTVAPLHGTYIAPGDGTVRYTPNLNYNGFDNFSYTVRDTVGAVSNAAVVTITVTPVADAPIAQNDLATTLVNTPVTIKVLANDSHPDGLPSAIVPASLLFTQPVTGTGTVTAGAVAGELIYTPAPFYTGPASFTYTVKDNATPVLTSLPANVSVTVAAPVIAPKAVSDVASTFVNTPRIISVLANDTAGSNPINPASVTIVGTPTIGTAVANPDGTVTFTSAAAGTSTFTYNVKDTTGVVSNNISVTVSIASVISDAVTVLRAQYTLAKSQWDVQGTTTNLTTTPRTVTIYFGSGLNGPLIGTAVDAGGKWAFTSTSTPTVPNATSTISVSLPSGASRLAFPVAVK